MHSSGPKSGITSPAQEMTPQTPVEAGVLGEEGASSVVTPGANAYAPAFAASSNSSNNNLLIFDGSVGNQQAPRAMQQSNSVPNSAVMSSDQPTPAGLVNDAAASLDNSPRDDEYDVEGEGG